MRQTRDASSSSGIHFFRQTSSAKVMFSKYFDTRHFDLKPPLFQIMIKISQLRAS